MAPPTPLQFPRMVTRELSRVCWLRHVQHNGQHMQSQEGEKSLSRAEHGPGRLSQKVWDGEGMGRTVTICVRRRATSLASAAYTLHKYTIPTVKTHFPYVVHQSRFRPNRLPVQTEPLFRVAPRPIRPGHWAISAPCGPATAGYPRASVSLCRPGITRKTPQPPPQYRQQAQ